MSKYADFLFIYEVKARELETMALLTYELERRGYSVAHINTWKNINKIFKRRIKCKVALVFGAYNTDVIDFVLDYIRECKKIVNLQWEQLLGLGQKKDPNSYYYFNGKAKEVGVTHFCWGNENYDRLVNECGINASNVQITGHIGLDLLRPAFKGFYKSREEICSQYGINQKKRILLFISSFSYINIPGRMENEAGDTFAKFSIESQKIILDWFRSLLSIRDDIILIYRPHPAEADNLMLLEMQRRFDSFYVISDYSVKQWITVSDLVLNWYSTSIMEVYKGKKSCYVLRPVPVNQDDDMTIFKNAEYITEYEDFISVINKNDYYFPIPEEDLKNIYYIDDKEPSYIIASNVLESIFKDDKNCIPKGFHNRWIFDKKRFLGKIPPIWLMIHTYRHIMARMGDDAAKEQIDFDSYCKQMSKRNYVSSRELHAMISKISNILNGNS